MTFASDSCTAAPVPRARTALAARIVLGAVLSLSVLACANTFPAPNSDEETLEVVFDVSSVSDFIRQTETGHNVSQFSLGWFIDTLLIDIASRDEELFRYFHRDGLLMSSYLQTTFQSHPREEIATLLRMADDGNQTLRLAACHALGALLYIPNAKDPPAVQDNDRRLLLGELTALRELQLQARDQARPR
ncbi:hypothetical protein [Magnetospirillum fulvum]|uniref:HEAT repeat domain-containing protein n=1 Tax=Magnetospirillum fulvum TaxID=1082 RepID=A0A1H6I6X9_MAGFU|nr:hypothetical protein [Magnetospirillum fulvum]SEH44851.1 hypothetical protein SAMN04244559_02370 [Magnetospirillum fulvum]